MAELRSKGVLKLVCFDFCNVFILIFHVPFCLIIPNIYLSDYSVNIWEKFPKSLKSMKLREFQVPNLWGYAVHYAAIPM